MGALSLPGRVEATKRHACRVNDFIDSRDLADIFSKDTSIF
jgi:hypothetical protein